MNKSLVSISCVALLATTSCANMTLRYHADVKAEDGSEGTFDYKQSYGTGLEWWCGLTFWVYGGACWLYPFKPSYDDRKTIEADAKMELNPLIKGDYEIVSASVTFSHWGAEPLSKNLALNQREKHPVSPEEFEKSIVEKAPSGHEHEKLSFPDGWPEKWFYQTEDYKYWTIVGEPARNPAEAIVSSKKKADEVIHAEFPNPKQPIHYETTHDDNRMVKGKYESWRIIRVKRSEVDQ